jgi:hypothetical protein
MVAKHSPTGLIATTSAKAAPPLDDLVDSCRWPLVLDANPRRLQRALAFYAPECVLFWLDDWLGIADTARLIAWSRERGQRPFRVAVAHNIEANVEPALRSAGAHGFLLLHGQSIDFVADSLWPLLQSLSRPAAATASSAALAVAASAHASADSSYNLVRPP